MYLHARNADVDTFSEINIMKFNGGLMTDISIFERNTSGIFNLCCSGEMKRNVKKCKVIKFRCPDSTDE